MATHTPGPWVAGRPDMGTVVDGFESKWIYSADDQYVAVASGRIQGEWSEVMANAHLIAAAPELLEALRFVREHIVTNLKGHDGCRCLICEAIPVECDKAIAKATGGVR